MIVQRTALALLCGVALATSGHAAVDTEHLEKFGTGIIADYSAMHAGDDIEWVWVAAGKQLHNHRFEAAPVRNLTAFDDDDAEDVLNSRLGKVLNKVGSADAAADVLQVDAAIYWAQRSSTKKLWIPYAGGHLAQAGLGIELVFKDASGAIVAQIRHSGREGDKLKDAAEELLEDLRRFVQAN